MSSRTETGPSTSTTHWESRKHTLSEMFSAQSQQRFRAVRAAADRLVLQTLAGAQLPTPLGADYQNSEHRTLGPTIHCLELTFQKRDLTRLHARR